MSKADEIFGILGYEKAEENIYENKIENITYKKTIEDDGFTTIVKIIEIYNPKFYIKLFINLTEINTDTYTKDSFNLSVQELQAINEKVKELGWLDE